MAINIFNPAPVKVLGTRGYEAWARWHNEAGLYEVFCDRECEGFLGEVDSLADARALAREWMAEREAN